MVFVMLKDGAVEQEAAETPRDEHGIGTGSQIIQRPLVRDEGEQETDGRHRHADIAKYPE